MSIDWSLVGPALMIVGLLCLSAFFSGSETSLTATSRARMLQLEKDGTPAAGRVNRLISDGESLLGSILLGNEPSVEFAGGAGTPIGPPGPKKA